MIRRILEEFEDGFTLLEMLVSLALLSFLGLIILGALNFGGRAWDRLGIENSDDAHVGQYQALNALFSNAFPAAASGAQAIPKPAFYSESDAFSFSSTLPGWGEYKRVSISYDRLNQHVILSVGSDRVDIREPHEDIEAEHIILADGVEEFAVRYWPELGGPQSAIGQWSTADRLPFAVGVRFSGKDGDTDWVFRTRLNGRGSCVIDPVTRGCRDGVS